LIYPKFEMYACFFFNDFSVYSVPLCFKLPSRSIINHLSVRVPGGVRRRLQRRA
jgi:hypothetical protein